MIYHIYDFKKMPHFISPEGLEFLWLTKKDILDISLMENPIFVDKIFSYKIEK